MGKPRLIILVRHAQSEGNKNRDIHQTTPDHRVKLTAEGWKQAEAAGQKLRGLLSPKDTLHFYTSPYRRARETTEGILNTLTASTPLIPNEPQPAPAPAEAAASTTTKKSSSSPSPNLSRTSTPFPRHTIKVYEEPRLREQDFGNFQPSSAEMSRMWSERASYGHFFYRIPNGESAADAYDRISGFNESLWRSFSESDFASVCILVTHGLMARVFLMKWYHFSVEYFEDLRNVEHCEFIVLKLEQGTGKYRLMNELRTWSALRREREERERAEKGGRTPESPVPVRKKWSGCMEVEEKGGKAEKEGAWRAESAWDEQQGGGQMGDDFARRQARRRDTSDFFADSPVSAHPTDQSAPARTVDTNAPTLPAPQPHRPPPLPLPDYLSAGRDGGGSRSGASSPAFPTLHEPPAVPAKQGKTSMGQALSGQLDADRVPDRSSPWADALGDQSDADDENLEGDDLDALRRAEMSVDGSVR